jgi:hypothetical protein
MSTLYDIESRVTGIVGDDSGKLKDVPRNITAAISRYSKHRPDSEVVDVPGNGTHDYAISLLTGWSEEFSNITQVEYPVDEVPESLLDADDYYIYRKPSGLVLRLVNETPEDTDTFRVTFTVPRTEDTIPDADVDAVSYLAAALCCEDLANAFAQTSDSTIGADSVNYRTKSQEFASRAKRLKALYSEHVGIQEGDSAPASAVVKDLDVRYPGGADRLTHPRRKRERR